MRTVTLPGGKVAPILTTRFFCPRCGGLLRRKHLTKDSTLLDQLPCRKCGYSIVVWYSNV